MKRLFICLIALLSVTMLMAQQVFHTIQRGETLESIAKKYHISVNDLKQANPNTADMCYAGQKLIIPSPSNNVSVDNSQIETKSNAPVQNDIQAKTGIAQQSTYQNDTNVGKDMNTADVNYEQDGGLDIQYHAIDDGWGISLESVVKYIIFGLEYNFGKTPEGVTSNSGLEIYLGGNYRYYLTENFYFEGRLLAGYYQWDVKYNKKIGIDDQKQREAFVGLSPRAGIKFGKLGISAGYRWDWVKMKFDKENCLDRFTVGLTVYF